MTLSVRDATVRFGGVTALSAVSLDIQPGAIAAVVGPNGSGKSTLFNAISGLVSLAGGTVRLGARDLGSEPPHRRIAAGIARTFQTPRFDPRETVEHAVMCGFYPVARTGAFAALFRTPAASHDERQKRDACRTILDDLGLAPYARLPMGELPMGHVRIVEVARAIANTPKFLLVDEPAAGLTRAEQETLAAELRRVAASGVGVLLVEHNFRMVRELAADVLVLNRGQVLLRGAVADIERNPAFVEAYLGSSALAMVPA